MASISAATFTLGRRGPAREWFADILYRDQNKGPIGRRRSFELVYNEINGQWYCHKLWTDRFVGESHYVVLPKKFKAALLTAAIRDGFIPVITKRS